MELGLFIPQGWRQDLTGIAPADHWQVMSGLARRADEGDTFASIWVYDHVHTVPEPVAEATHEAWTLMSAFAASTSRVRLGQMCTCMGYRNPAYLAKVAATADVVSGGRVDMGIGAGWYEHEWRAYGYGYPRTGERLTMLDEGVEIMKQMWETGSATFAGEHYTVDGAMCYPQPLAGRIPTWVAGGGEKRTLRTAARVADYTNFAGEPDAFAHKSSVLEAHCRDLGRDYGEITRSANFNVVLGETEAEVADTIERYAAHMRRTVSAEAAEREIAGLRGSLGVGTPEQVAENLRRMGDLGMGYAIVYVPLVAYETRTLDLFEQQVAPALR